METLRILGRTATGSLETRIWVSLQLEKMAKMVLPDWQERPVVPPMRCGASMSGRA